MHLICAYNFNRPHSYQTHVLDSYCVTLEKYVHFAYYTEITNIR